jgi:hypothetical protein
MNTHEVATKLVGYCREGKNIDAIKELYSDGIVSKEPGRSDGEITEGKEAVLAKNQHWFASVEEVHSVAISDPIITGNLFACTMEMDVTYKGHGRMFMYEIAVYGVKDGLIVSDQFFYHM